MLLLELSHLLLLEERVSVELTEDGGVDVGFDEGSLDLPVDLQEEVLHVVEEPSHLLPVFQAYEDVTPVAICVDEVVLH